MLNKHEKTYFSKISDTALSIISNYSYSNIINFIGTGPSIKARARLALCMVFLIAIPIFVISVIRTERVLIDSSTLTKYDNFYKKVFDIELLVKDLEITIWNYTDEAEFKNAQKIYLVLDKLHNSIFNLGFYLPKEISNIYLLNIENIYSRTEFLIKKAINTDYSFAHSRISILNLLQEVFKLESEALSISNQYHAKTATSISNINRDQLIFLLVLLFSMIIFIFFVSHWILKPLERLKKLVTQIDTGKFNNLTIIGNDEIAYLARELQEYFIKEDEISQKKSAKIFEVRNILRFVINKVNEPIAILDNNLKISYANEALADLINIQSHQIEGKTVNDFIIADELKKHLTGAFLGFFNDEEFNINIRLLDGREYFVTSKIGIIRNRESSISRTVLVFSSVKEK